MKIPAPKSSTEIVPRINFKAMVKTPNNRDISAIAKILSQDTQDIINLTNNISNNRFAFLEALVRRYNLSEFRKSSSEKANPQLITKVFQTVVNPQNAHFDLIKQFKGSISDLASLFMVTSGNLNEVSFLNTIQKKVVKGDKNFCAKLLIELLSSPNKTNFINKFKEYSSYLNLNKYNPNAIKNLEDMLNNGTYNYKHYDKMMDKQYLMKNYPLKYESEIFNKNVYANNYTNERDLVLSYLHKYCNLPMKESEPELDNEILNTFMSTTKKNYNTRKKLIQHYSYITKTKNVEDKVNFFKGLNQLFEIIDNNKDAKNFVKKAMKANIPINDIGIFSQLFEQIPSRKLNIFHKNALCLIKRLDGKKENIPLMEQKLENLMFLSNQAHLSNSYRHYNIFDNITTIINKVINKYNLLRYRISNYMHGSPTTINK